MTTERYAVFCDFDGTVARRDVGYHMYLHFSQGRSEELIPDWKSGRLSTRECLRRESEMFSGTAEEFYSFLDQFGLNPGFPEFVQKCRANNIEPAIISDGLDLYVRYILERHGITDLAIYSNQGKLVDGRLELNFPYPDIDSSGEGVGKQRRIAELKAAIGIPVTTVFVGDGLSDVGAVAEADILFAKKDLSEYCDRRNIAYTCYDTFFDVTASLTERSVFIR